MTARPGQVSWADDGFVVPDSVRQRWEKIFSNVDLDLEIATAHCWCIDNPHKRPKSCFQSFLSRWMRRSHDQNLRKAPPPTPECCDQRAEIARLLQRGLKEGPRR